MIYVLETFVHVVTAATNFPPPGFGVVESHPVKPVAAMNVAQWVRRFTPPIRLPSRFCRVNVLPAAGDSGMLAGPSTLFHHLISLLAKKSRPFGLGGWVDLKPEGTGRDNKELN